MAPRRPSVVFRRILVGAALLLGEAGAAHCADAPRSVSANSIASETPDVAIGELPALIDPVRENEGLYARLETILRKTKKPGTPGNWKRFRFTVAENLETVHTVVQDELVYCHVDKTVTSALTGDEFRLERVSASDSHETRSVDY